LVTDDATRAGKGVNFIYTDVWVCIGGSDDDGATIHHIVRNRMGAPHPTT
jgi:ornithine carbamoyltransferase